MRDYSHLRRIKAAHYASRLTASTSLFMLAASTASRQVMAVTVTTLTEPTPVNTTRHDGDVLASFNYWGIEDLPKVSEIQQIFNGSSPHLRSVPMTVRDARSSGLSHFSLDTHAFQILRHSSSILPPRTPGVPDFHVPDLMQLTYWPELVGLLKAQLGVRAAVAINTTVRDIPADGLKQLNPNNPRADPKTSFHPFFIVHGDYTPAGARGHMRAMLPTFFEDNGCSTSTTAEERDAFFRLRNEILDAENAAMAAEGVEDQWNWSGSNYPGPRWAMLSVWRPLETVQRDPLAVMDPGSLFNGASAKPFASFERIYRQRPGFEAEYKSENMLPIAPQAGQQQHQWYYISEQTPEEVFALKLFDSEAHKAGSSVAPCLPHSAFALPDQEDKPLRRSAEVRVMIIW